MELAYELLDETVDVVSLEVTSLEEKELLEEDTSLDELEEEDELEVETGLLEELLEEGNSTMEVYKVKAILKYEGLEPVILPIWKA
jgi:hypothetical protein